MKRRKKKRQGNDAIKLEAQSGMCFLLFFYTVFGEYVSGAWIDRTGSLDLRL